MLGKVQRIAPAYLEYLNSGFKTFYKNILYNYFVFFYSNSYFTRTWLSNAKFEVSIYFLSKLFIKIKINK